MTLQISTSNDIIINSEYTGLYVTQKRDGTVVYSADHGGKNYKEYKMPHPRYSTTHPKPASGAAGSLQFEQDIKALLKELNG